MDLFTFGSFGSDKDHFVTADMQKHKKILNMN